MGAIPAGRTGAISNMRRNFATTRRSDAACPVASSLDARISAEAALEQLAAGRTPSWIVPFGRVFDEGSTKDMT
jgi:hypothetical protein